jgi:hypothetical protein
LGVHQADRWWPMGRIGAGPGHPRCHGARDDSEEEGSNEEWVAPSAVPAARIGMSSSAEHPTLGIKALSKVKYGADTLTRGWG